MPSLAVCAASRVAGVATMAPKVWIEPRRCRLAPATVIIPSLARQFQAEVPPFLLRQSLRLPQSLPQAQCRLSRRLRLLGPRGRTLTTVSTTPTAGRRLTRPGRPRAAYQIWETPTSPDLPYYPRSPRLASATTPSTSTLLLSSPQPDLTFDHTPCRPHSHPRSSQTAALPCRKTTSSLLLSLPLIIPLLQRQDPEGHHPSEHPRLSLSTFSRTRSFFHFLHFLHSHLSHLSHLSHRTHHRLQLLVVSSAFAAAFLDPSTPFAA